MSTPAESPRVSAGLPRVIIFDVNETLSDLAPMQELWKAAGVPAHIAALWFAEVLRDGFALTATLQNAPFATIAGDVARRLLRAAGAVDVDASTDRIVAGFSTLGVHPDVVEGVRALRTLCIPLITLSNGGAEVAEGLLERSGLRSDFDVLLSVEAAGHWKPAPPSYRYALDTCGVPAEQAMLVAVHPWDINGAAAAGMRTAWVARAHEPYPTHFSQPEITADSLVDLARQLAASRPV